MDVGAGNCKEKKNCYLGKDADTTSLGFLGWGRFRELETHDYKQRQMGKSTFTVSLLDMEHRALEHNILLTNEHGETQSY